MPKQHQQPAAHDSLATLLTLAVAPLGSPFSGNLLKHLHGDKAFAATPDAVAMLLGNAGFDQMPMTAGEMADCRFPLLVWQQDSGPYLKLPDGQWHGPDAKPRGPLEVQPGAEGLAITGAPEQDENSFSEIKDIVSTYKPQLIQVALLGLLINVGGMAIPLFSMAVYDRVLPVGATRTLWLLAMGISLVLAFDIVLRILRSYGLTSVLAKASLKQDGPLLAMLLRQRGTGTRWAEQIELMKLVHDVREQVIMHILPTLADIPFVIMFLVAIGCVAPALLPVPLVLLVLTLLVQMVVLPKLKSSARGLTHAHHLRAQLLLETLRSATATRLGNRQNEAMGRWHVFETKVTAAESRGQFWNSFGQHVTITVAQLSFVLTLVMGCELVMSGELTVGALVATSLLSSRTISPALHLIDTLTRIQSVRANLRLIRRGMSWPTEPLMVTAATPETLGICRGEVVLDNVSVKHHVNDSRGVIEGLNIKMAGGERWGVVGGIGAGKSTLLAVLAALVEPTEGEAKLDGVSYKRMPVSEIRRHVSLVSQTPVFADLSVREIVAGMRPVDEVRMREVMVVSGFESVLAQHGGGMEFRPGANGERLSGGQRQMLALAVALYAEPKVLLLDEPTSQFDSEAERAFCARMKGWLAAREVTLVLVTHREALLDLVDNLVVLVHGRVVFGGRKKAVLEQLKMPPQKPAATPKELADGKRAA